MLKALLILLQTALATPSYTLDTMDLSVTAPVRANVESIVKTQFTIFQGRKPTQQEVKNLTCLTLNVFWEARAEPTMGKIAVARVTLNRLSDARYPTNMCAVVYQQTKNVCQFSWACKKELKDQNPYVRVSLNAAEYKALVTSAAVAVHSIDYDHDITEGALFFHATYVSPKWKKKMRRVRVGRVDQGKIGNHIFYVHR